MAEPLPDNAVSKTGLPAPLPDGHPLPAEVHADRATLAVAMRLQGYTYRQIEQHTGLSKGQLQISLMRARSTGELSDVTNLVDHDAVPQAVENLRRLLRKGDREATFKTLQGRGVFRNFSHNKSEHIPGGQLPGLTIEVIDAPGQTRTAVVNDERGAVIGSPNGD